MKKFATMLLALLLTAALTVPAMATFTPSSENKDAPEIISALREAAAHYRQHDPKGEFVLVVEGAKPKETREEYTLEEAAELARDFLQDGVSASEAAREAAKVSGLKKGDIYRLLG